MWRRPAALRQPNADYVIRAWGCSAKRLNASMRRRCALRMAGCAKKPMILPSRPLKVNISSEVRRAVLGVTAAYFTVIATTTFDPSRLRRESCGKPFEMTVARKTTPRRRHEPDARLASTFGRSVRPPRR